MDIIANNTKTSLIDPFGRPITYLRVSVTDRCDLRCVYCMAENMTFLPRRDLLSLEELERLCIAFIAKGVRKIRITGGEPLVRKNITRLLDALGQQIDAGQLDEVTLTTNGTQLAHFANALYDIGMRRINVSLDTLDPQKFKTVTRWGDFNKVMTGIDTALAAGLKIKINTVALKGFNDEEIDDLIRWAHGRGMDMTLIETMPMGEIEVERNDQYISLKQLRTDMEKRWTLHDIDYNSGGPARYVDIMETGGRLGFITPLSHNFCESCNRIRVTCTGTLYMCLGQEDAADLRAPMRASADNALLNDVIDEAILRKPKGHDFKIDRTTNRPAVARHMSVTGG